MNTAFVVLGRVSASTEIEIWIREGTLPRTQEERQSIVCRLRPGEPVYGSQETAALGDRIGHRQHVFPQYR